MHYSPTNVLWERSQGSFLPPPPFWFCQHRGQAIKLLVGGRLSLCPWHKHNKQTPTAGLRKQDVLWDVCCLLGNSYQHSWGDLGRPTPLLTSLRTIQINLNNTHSWLKGSGGPCCCFGGDDSSGRRHAKGQHFKSLNNEKWPCHYCSCDYVEMWSCVVQQQWGSLHCYLMPRLEQFRSNLFLRAPTYSVLSWEDIFISGNNDHIISISFLELSNMYKR